MKPLRPYLYNAYYNWIIDNDNTPYLLVNSEYPDVDVPVEFVKEGKIILNISSRSIGQYIATEEYIGFSARFQGMLRDIHIPFGAMEAIYAQETGDGIMFQEEEYYSVEAYQARLGTEKIQNPKVKKASTLKLVK
ncbi:MULTISPECIES: ClpXP protease specificity-enhancing factor [Mannheimia]|uniref:ClpXP protease specificity-enhancing factor n=1 Tax=Mannheimia pernigra TaxID=111844 RepID=A0ABD7A943_9PAST|nr:MULTISPECIES: ClpXP protease specificity-enhancing factor [Mannheimia]QHB17778.1 ClpXP protease specificity-enhancing factor [Mannheimia pernigra]QLB42783.1 ClpXP protease specificity-enhancing factor [Mannheimia pernigra]QLB44786.1 ClpXP protease specificity-enhancing factor [Mannheimia pernigra]QTM01803.1 ClpXP protease specificity-enhancing factor [Mannheimia sp. ZY171111]